MKKAGALFLFVLCFLLSGFYFHRGNQNTEYAGGILKPQTLLTFLGFQYADKNEWSLEYVLDIYTKNHPNILVSYESIPKPGYFQILELRIRMNSMDDVFMVSPYDARRYAAGGKLADLKDLSVLEGFRPEVLRQMHVEGMVPYLTTSLGAFGLYCNLRMLNRNGIAIPQNMGMFIAACERLRQAGIAPISASGFDALKALVIARSFRDALYGSPEEFFAGMQMHPERLENLLTEGLTFLRLLLERGYLDLTGVSDAGQTSFGLFAKGESPFMIGGVWLSPQLEKKRPGRWFKVFPLPLGTEGGIAVLRLDTPLAVNKNSPRLKEALSLVESLAEPDTVRAFNDAQGLFSPLKNAPKPADSAVYPLWESINQGHAVFHSDIRLPCPVWEKLDAGVDMILSGACAKDAAKKVMQSLFPDK